jgi:hypothetical protein
VNVFAFAGPFGGAFAVNRIVGEQDSVALEMRTASGGVGDDRIQLPEVEAVEITPGELAREFGFAVMAAQRSAAYLHRRGVHLATIRKQNVDCVAVNIRKDQVLDTSGQHADVVSRLVVRRAFDAPNELVRKLGLDRRGLRLQLAEFAGEEAVQLQPAEQILETSDLE